MKRLLVTLTPAESKRLIAKALLETDEVRNALDNGYLCITLGTTSAYLVEEILKDYDKTKHIAGLVIPKGGWVTDAETRAYDAIFYKGEFLREKKVKDVLDEMGPNDVIIKSANALDANFQPIVLLASTTGGTVGSFIGAASAKNIKVIVPIGLEKCIPAVFEDFSAEIGIDCWDYVMGLGVGAMTIPNAIVFTEIEALEILFGVEAIPIAAGGVNGAEGSVMLYIKGEDEDVENAFEFLRTIKGEPPFPTVENIVE